MHVYSQLIEAQLENTSSSPTPRAAGIIKWHTTNKRILVDDGSEIVTFSPGGGAGGALIWLADNSGSAPAEDIEFSQRVWRFGAGITQYLRAGLRVPSSYPGTQVSLLLHFYSPSASGSFLMRSISTLIKKDTGAMDNYSYQRTSTNNSVSNSVSNMLRQVTFDLTDSSGQISGQSVSPGDLILLSLYRDTDTDSGDVRFLPGGAEVSI